MKTKAALSLSLALLTALSSLCACGGAGSQGGGPEGDVPSGGEAQTEETTESPLAAIPAADYGGHVFRFIHDENSDLWFDSTLYAEEMTGAVLDDTVIRAQPLRKREAERRHTGGILKRGAEEGIESGAVGKL